MSERQQINRWANRALENLYGGWLALAEHQLMLIIEATGGLDPDTTDARAALRVRPRDLSWAVVYAALNDDEVRRAATPPPGQEDAGQGAERGDATDNVLA